MVLDYESLRVIWWVLLGVLLIGFAIMDGFDLGVAMWLPWLGKNDMERRIIINTIAPTWEGNQVWFILGGGAIFAAWPALYALSFSGFYLAMLVVLLALILRPVGFKYRSKLSNTTWRQAWDIALFIGGFVPALIFGVAIGNVIQGVPFYFDDSLRSFYTGSFWALLNPFALGTGLLSVTMLAMHGANFLNVKTNGIIQARARQAARASALLSLLLFVGLGYWVMADIPGYHLVQSVAHDGPSNPLFKNVGRALGDWFINYQNLPITQAAPIAALAGLCLVVLFVNQALFAFLCSALAVAGIIATVGVSMFPFILPSSSVPNASLLVWDSSSSALTLWIMLIATLIFLPIVLTYTAWVYRVLRGKVTKATVESNHSSY